MSELYLSQSVHLLLSQSKEKRKVVKVACFITTSNESIQGVLFMNIFMCFNTQSLFSQKKWWLACCILLCYQVAALSLPTQIMTYSFKALEHNMPGLLLECAKIQNL